MKLAFLSHYRTLTLRWRAKRSHCAVGRSAGLARRLAGLLARCATSIRVIDCARSASRTSHRIGPCVRKRGSSPPAVDRPCYGPKSTPFFVGSESRPGPFIQDQDPASISEECEAGRLAPACALQRTAGRADSRTGTRGRVDRRAMLRGVGVNKHIGNTTVSRTPHTRFTPTHTPTHTLAAHTVAPHRENVPFPPFFLLLLRARAPDGNKLFSQHFFFLIEM